MRVAPSIGTLAMGADMRVAPGTGTLAKGADMRVAPGTGTLAMEADMRVALPGARGTRRTTDPHPQPDGRD